MQGLGAVLLLVLLGVLVHGQDNCSTNPCQQGGVCTLKPNGDPFCECTESNEGERCDTPSVGVCTDPVRNFYGAKHGIVTSQDFPSLYPNSQNCPYFIGAADAKKVEITFNFLQLENAKDELAIGMGSVADFQKATYTFDQSQYNPLPGAIEMTGDRMWLNLFTDQNEQRMGFNISYRIDGNECLPDPCLSGETCTDLEYSYTCTNIDTGLCTPNACQNSGICSVTPAGAPFCACSEGFEGDYCQTVSPGNCVDANRNFYNQREGQITSPNFPMNYPNNQDCAYFIGAPDAKKIEITFRSLGLQESGDNVTIGNGTSVDNAASLFSYSSPSVSPLPGPLNLSPFPSLSVVQSKSMQAERSVCTQTQWQSLLPVPCGLPRRFLPEFTDGDECLSNPCLNGDKCVDLEYTFACQVVGGPVTTTSASTASPSSVTNAPVTTSRAPPKTGDDSDSAEDGGAALGGDDDDDDDDDSQEGNGGGNVQRPKKQWRRKQRKPRNRKRED